jgi:hypothetical protein
MEFYIRSATKLRSDLRQRADRDVPRELTRGERGALIGRLNRILGSDAARRTVLAYLFSPAGKRVHELSTRALSVGQWWALWEWVGFTPGDEPGEWLTAPSFPQEALAALNAAIRSGRRAAPATVREGVRFLGGEVVEVEKDRSHERWDELFGVQAEPTDDDFPIPF